MSTESIPSQITDYGDTLPVGEKIDFLAYHLRMQTNRLDALFAILDRVERKLDSVGQLSTNTDAFCQQIRTAMEEARRNPLMRGMVPPIPPPQPPGKLLG